MITVTKFFDDDGITLRASFECEDMASAISCPAEHASRYNGSYALDLHECVNDDTGEEYEPTAFQLELLQAEAMDEIKSARTPRGWWED